MIMYVIVIILFRPVGLLVLKKTFNLGINKVKGHIRIAKLVNVVSV
jgi:hypothetical protein